MSTTPDLPVFDLYEQYALEREGLLFVRHPFGFASYKMMHADLYWLVDIFVLPSQRRNGIAYELSAEVAKIALAAGAKQLLGTVDIKANGVTESLKALLADGFRFSRAEGNIMYFLKDLPKGN